jgi:hypothetical protein
LTRWGIDLPYILVMHLLLDRVAAEQIRHSLYRIINCY